MQSEFNVVKLTQMMRSVMYNCLPSVNSGFTLLLLRRLLIDSSTVVVFVLVHFRLVLTQQHVSAQGTSLGECRQW